jgi:hypothetical protein
MIAIYKNLYEDSWRIEPIGRRYAFNEPPSNLRYNDCSKDLEKDLPPLLYGRYCMLHIAVSGERYEGLGYVIKYEDGSCNFYICEEE